MSDLLNSASLVMIPSGYKEDVVYSQIPTDGSGDLAFTRASNGTRVNSAGLIEVAPWNLVEQSEAFSNTAVWNVLNGASVTANTTTAPNGTTTADTLTFSTNVSSNVYCFCSAPVGANVVSVYAKVASGTKQFRLRVDLPGGTTSSNFTATTEWQRFEFAVTTTTANLVYYIINDSVGVAGDLYIWGAQLNIGSTAKPYFPTTDRLNVPRLTYQNGGGGCPSLLLEKQSTNLATYSEDFTNSDWIIQRATISANATISPDGTQNADKLIINNGITGGYIYQIKSTTSGTVYTGSFYIKAGGVGYTKFWTNISGSYEDAVINLSTGAITNSNFAITPTAQSVGNGWYRVVYTTTSGGGQVVVYVDGGSTSTGGSYTGNGTDGIFLWGAQVEASSYPTSYIPTTSSSATRVADACYKTGISSLFGTNQGTFFVDILYLNSSTPDYLFDVTDSSNTNRFLMFAANNTGLYLIYDSVSGGFTTYQLTNGQRYKIAVKYNSTATYWYINGVLVATGGYGFAYQMSQIYIGQRYSISNQSQIQVNETIVFPTALSGTELIALTTI